MKIYLLIILSLFAQDILAATSKKTSKKKEIVEDKVYIVEKTSPEILIGEGPKLVERKNSFYKRASELWYVSINRSSLKYSLPAITTNSLSFSPTLVGVTIGKKLADQFFLYKGYYEMSGEWQRFKRESTSGNMTNSQKLDLYQFNLFQNFNVGWALKHSLFFSVGMGLAPVYLTAEQSVLGNSVSSLGYMGMLKGNIIIPMKKSYEADVALRIGWGSMGSHEISATTLSLGLNFE